MPRSVLVNLDKRSTQCLFFSLQYRILHKYVSDSWDSIQEHPDLASVSNIEPEKLTATCACKSCSTACPSPIMNKCLLFSMYENVYSSAFESMKLKLLITTSAPTYRSLYVYCSSVPGLYLIPRSRNLPPTIPEFLSGGSNTDTVSLFMKYDNTNSRLSSAWFTYTNS